MATDYSFSGPHLAAAFLCEKILIERDNVPTFVRVVDRFSVPVFSGKLPPGVQLPQQILQCTLVVSLKAGDLGAGKQTIRIKLQKPDGSYLPENVSQVFFNGGEDNGTLLALPIALGAPDEGLHWFDVYWEQQLLTRIPMRVLYQPAALQFQPPPGDE